MSKKTLKSSTRFLLGRRKPFAGGKSYFRRGGVRFEVQSETLVDVEKIGRDRAQRILTEPQLDVQQLSAAQAKKYQEKQPVELAENQESEQLAYISELESAVAKMRKRATEFKRQLSELETAHNDLLEEHGKLQERYEELKDSHLQQSQMLDQVETQSEANDGQAADD